MSNDIYQNHLALDYLLASQGGVCGKFNLSNCCLQIDDEGKVKEEITDQIRKITHLPVQIWEGWNPRELFEGWFSTFGGSNPLKCYTFEGLPGSALPGPLIVRSVSSLIESMVERKETSHVMML
jgi:hypothetical protein